MDRLVQLGGKHASELEMEIGRLVEDWNPRAAKVHAQVHVADSHEEAARAASLSAPLPGAVPSFFWLRGALLIARPSAHAVFRALFFISTRVVLFAGESRCSPNPNGFFSNASLFCKLHHRFRALPA